MDDLISRQEALRIFEEHCYPVRYDHNSIEKGMTLTGIVEVLNITPSAQQWIPCSERLPEKDGEYLVTMLYFGEKTVEVDKFSHYETDDEHNGEPFWMYGYDNVIAWMPLPEPYRKE